MNSSVSKYRNKPTEVDGIRFASKREAGRYQELRLLERAKAIQGLQLQVRYPLKINDQLICTYIADFTYLENGCQLIVEDSKGHLTREYKIKKKMMKALYQIEIRET
jgi:hypothetical protein